jgi:hypothetical protein
VSNHPEVKSALSQLEMGWPLMSAPDPLDLDDLYE